MYQTLVSHDPSIWPVLANLLKNGIICKVDFPEKGACEQIFWQSYYTTILQFKFGGRRPLANFLDTLFQDFLDTSFQQDLPSIPRIKPELVVCPRLLWESMR